MLTRSSLPSISQNEKKERAGVTTLAVPVGRLNCVMRTLLVTALGFALEFLGDVFLHLTQLPHYLYAVQRIVLFFLVGSALLRTIKGRLQDVNISLAFAFPVFAIWLVSVSLSAFWSAGWSVGLALFLLLLIAGGSMTSKTLLATAPMAQDARANSNSAPRPSLAKESTLAFPSRLLVSQRGFLRSLVTLGCLWLPLIWLEALPDNGMTVWIARTGYLVLSIVWVFKILGRLADAGRLPRAIYGYAAIAAVFTMAATYHSYVGRQALHFAWETLLGGAYFDPLVKVCITRINAYELLAMLIAIQIPLALLPRARGMGAGADGDSTGMKSGTHAPVVKTNELSLSGPWEFVRILLVIACVWAPLIYMDGISSGGIGSWIARVGYILLGLFWLVFANGRLVDAGWGRSLYPSQYFLVVATASLMPLAVRLVNAYGALAIFVSVQIPTVFLKSKALPEIDADI